MSDPVPAAASELFGRSLDLATQYVAILADRGVSHGLLGPREVPRLWERHVLNSLAPSRFIPEGVDVLDIGSGAGLPGIPLALARPDLSVVLLEPLLRRSTFLASVIDELGLTGRVSVVRARAEDHCGQYPVVTARAVAPLVRLVGWAEPLLSDRGVILAMKGASAGEELEKASGVLQQLGPQGETTEVSVHPGGEATTVVSLRRTQ